MNKLRYRQLSFGAIACVAGIAALAIFEVKAAEDEVSMSWDSLPKAVRAALEAERPGETPTEIEQETEDGVVVYEAEYLKDGAEVEYELSADGTILEIESGDDEDDDEDDDDD